MAYWAQWQSFIVEDVCLWRIWHSEDFSWAKKLLLGPQARTSEIIREYHNGPRGGHLGITKTMEKFKENFYWVGIKDSVAVWIRNCDQCSKSKGPKSKPRGRLQQYNAGVPLERIAMDISGPFLSSNAGNKYVLVLIDYFSRWSKVYPITDQEANTIAKVFVNNWVTRFGTPIELHSDQSRNFESSIFQEVCQIFDINKTRTTPLHPQSDGIDERFNRTLQEHLRKVIDDNQQD
uniref:RNA-directed DNA polymerase n=1 Tax=Glossina morsitans morsitans TaxID=37546 RepID=A0A1B0FF49_GLOMM